MQELQVQLKDFRAFSDTGQIPIRPITILVGENSAGKTSFLAALNFILRFQESEVTELLNSGPFDLGSFDQIVHQNSYGPQKANFTFSFWKDVNVSGHGGILNILTRQLKPTDGKRKADWRRCRIDIVFGSSFGEATVVAIRLQMDIGSLEIGLQKNRQISISLPNDVKLKWKAQRDFDFDDAFQSNFKSTQRLAVEAQLALYEWRSEDKSVEAHDAEISLLFGAFGAILNSLPNHVYAGAPIRSVPERVYSATAVESAPDGRSIPYKLRRLKTSSAGRWSQLHRGLNRFGKMTGLYSGLDITKLTRDVAGPFQIRVKSGKRRDNLADVGYGVSQTLPLIAEMLEAPENASFLFQQPEVHLHPRAQAGLGTFFADYANSHLDTFIIIETHSDYLVDRIRYSVRSKGLPHHAVSLLYLEPTHGSTIIHSMQLDADGEIIDPPKCYREFFLREQEQLLGI